MEPAGPGPGEGTQALLAPLESGEACRVPAGRPGAGPSPTSLCRLLCAPGVTARSGGCLCTRSAVMEGSGLLCVTLSDTLLQGVRAGALPFVKWKNTSGVSWWS